MSNRAAFTIDSTASSPPGYIGTSSFTVYFQLEVLPATDVLRTQFEIARKSVGAPALVFPVSGEAIEIAATPGAEIYLDLPVVAGDDAVSYQIICRAVTAEDEFTFSRVISIPNVLGLRKWVELEQAEFHTTGWYNDQNALVDAMAAVVAGSISLDHGGLSGLADDDHAQYDLAAPPVTALSGAANTLALTHTRKWLRVSHGSATVLTVPPNASVAFPVGSIIRGVQGGAGQLSIAPGGGVTINAITLLVPGQFGWFELKKIATDTWDLFVEASAASIAGDVTGTLAASTVVKIRNKGVDASVGTPALGDFLIYDGTNWKNLKTATQTNIAYAQTVGLEFENTTAATDPAPHQASPALKFTGHFWGGSDQQHSAFIQLLGRAPNPTPNPEVPDPLDSELTFLSGSGDSLVGIGTWSADTTHVAFFAGTEALRLTVEPTSVVFEQFDATESYPTCEFRVIGAGINHATNAAGVIVLETGTNAGAGPDGLFGIQIGPNPALLVFDFSGAVAVTGVGDYGNFSITATSPSTGIGGRNVSVTGGSGGTGNQNGGLAYLRGGLASGSGTSGEAQIQGSAGTSKLRVSETGCAVNGKAPLAPPSVTTFALIDNTAGTPSLTLAALPTLTDSPASVDALRDDIMTNWAPVLRNWAASQASAHNAHLDAQNDFRSLGDP